MVKFELNDKQKEAVFTYGKDIILSAAAGSGKTGVLTQRVLELICAGADISRMLVVTFTDAAAAEMRVRIRSALEQRAAETGNARLARQAESVSTADICTMHSFANRVIRENFALLGLRADIHVASGSQIALKKAEALEQCFAGFYEMEDEQFLWLRDRYSGRTDDGIEELVLSVYAHVQSYPEGIAWLEDAGNLDINGYMAYVRGQIADALLQLEDLNEEAIVLDERYTSSDSQMGKNLQDAQAVAQLKSAYANEDDMACAALLTALSKSRVSPLKDKEHGNLLKANKAQLRDIAKALLQRLPNKTQVTLQKEAAYMAQLGDALYHVVQSFSKIYYEEKHELGIMDFDDMMHYALQLLQIDDVRKTYSGRYDYLFVDEYQDTNPVQDALLGTLTLPVGGRFAVGDMKQSIYRFRLADPLIFKEKVHQLQQTEHGQAIFMNQNFRSVPDVIGFINFVMAGLMSERLGEIDYTADEALLAGVDAAGHVELLLTDAADGMEREQDNTVKEAHTIARRISALLQETKADDTLYQPQDICILLRNSAGNDQVFAKVLSRHGIPAETAKAKTAIGPEVEVFVNLMRLVDGFYSDIALLSVMHSYLGGFTEADFAGVRSISHEDTFTQCFLAYAEGKDALAQKCKALLTEIKKFRTYAQAMQLQDFLILLKDETKYEAYTAALPGGEDKLNRFAAFFAWCLGEAEQVASLHSFLARLEAIHKKEGSYGGAVEAAGGNFVRIMSIHNAKGLEFPIVFLARMQTPFSSEDFKKPILLHKEYGIGSDGVYAENRTKEPFVCKQILKDVLSAEQKSEELRVLYVAMTRAKEQLILSAALKDPLKAIAKHAGHTKEYELLGMGNMLQWLLAVLFLPCISEEIQPQTAFDLAYVILPSADTTQAMGQTRPGEKEVLEAAGKLPYQPFLAYEAKKIPAKIGVSALLPEDDVGISIPAYTTVSGDSGAELGSLIHLFMQHLDLSVNSIAEIEIAATNMVQKLLLTEAECKRILRFSPEILAFLGSDIALRARAAKYLRREVAFSMQVPADEIGIADAPDKVILQGIIDMLFEEADGYVIVDYKSNMADEVRMRTLAAHYETQVAAYRMAVERITGKPVKECYLWFLRAGQKFRVY